MTKLDEFKLINFIKQHNTKPAKIHNVSVDIGDDCFAYKSHNKAEYVVTTDILIENIHFKTAWATPEQIGRKAVEVNISDIASMGNAKPLYAFICLGIPRNTSEKFVKRLFSSIKKTCNKYGIHLSGGDTVGAEAVTLSITLVGIAYDKVITRTGAKKGDLIFVSGTFGDSGAGLEAIYNKRQKNDVQCTVYNKSFTHSPIHPFTKYERQLVKKHLQPEARLKLANDLVKKIKVTSMTDSSDGLFKSVELLADKKGAVINVEDIPVSKDLIKYCVGDLKKLYNFALFGGEEFELVFTIDKKDGQKAKKLFKNIKCIGAVTGSKKIKYLFNGKERNIKYSGYEHF